MFGPPQKLFQLVYAVAQLSALLVTGLLLSYCPRQLTPTYLQLEPLALQLGFEGTYVKYLGIGQVEVSLELELLFVHRSLLGLSVLDSPSERLNLPVEVVDLPRIMARCLGVVVGSYIFIQGLLQDRNLACKLLNGGSEMLSFAFSDLEIAGGIG